MKLNPRVTELALYDIRGSPGLRIFVSARVTDADLGVGVAADIGHINTRSTVTGYQPNDDDDAGLKTALAGASVVLIPAGVPRKPGMTRDGR